MPIRPVLFVSAPSPTRIVVTFTGKKKPPSSGWQKPEKPKATPHRAFVATGLTLWAFMHTGVGAVCLKLGYIFEGVTALAAAAGLATVTTHLFKDKHDQKEK